VLNNKLATKRPSSDDEEEEFEDDFDDEEVQPKKSKPKVVEEESEEDTSFEDDDKGYEEEKVETRGRPKGTFRTPQKVQAQKIQQKKEIIESEELYSVYHQIERHGIKNNKTNESIGEDTLNLLCIILNKIHNLEVNLIGSGE